MSALHGDTVTVPGARLFYQRSGTGPVLLIISGGAGDADASPRLVAALARHYTVITYDRRGLSQSRPTHDVETLELRTHTDDVHHLLTALTTEPALVFGCSIGALIGLDLVCRHADQVSALVAHDPPLPQLLPEQERIKSERDQVEMEEIYQRAGIGPAMAKIVTFLGIDFDQDREPDVEMPPPSARRLADMAFFFQHDAPAARRYRLDLTALRSAAIRVVPAAGRTSRNTWVSHCSDRLADVLGTSVVEFPGGHSGYVFHPEAFAETLHRTLVAALRHPPRPRGGVV
jgi:pimeloyl-ACP methyl ester carboxylesterase